MLQRTGYRPYLAEFIRGTGVRINGTVVQDVDGTGPFSWVVPDDVVELESLALQGGGEGGGSGMDETGFTSVGGGAGGGCGGTRIGHKVAVIPGSTIVITVGAGGAGQTLTTSPGSSMGGDGGNSTIEGVLPGSSLAGDGTRIACRGGSSFLSNPATGSASIATNGTGTAAVDTAGTDTSRNMGANALGAEGRWVQPSSGGGGGGGNASGAVAGRNGGHCGLGFNDLNASELSDGTYSIAGTGTTTGTISRGGGGAGSLTQFGRGGAGGSNGAGGAALGYGAGGGGGSGGFGGGAGANGYCRFVYWSAR